MEATGSPPHSTAAVAPAAENNATTTGSRPYSTTDISPSAENYATPDPAVSQSISKSSSEPMEIIGSTAEPMEINDVGAGPAPESQNATGAPTAQETAAAQENFHGHDLFVCLASSPSSHATQTLRHGRPRRLCSRTTPQAQGPADLSKEVDIEALIAISVGFPVDSLTEEEIEANVVSQIGGAEQANYIIVRNHILARWRSNVAVWLTKDQVLESIRAEHKNLVNAAYNFLLHHGYINFGVAPAIKDVKSKLFCETPKGSVIVIGAGLSGLVAARQLIFLGFKVVVLEGRARPGGRVRTKKMSGTDGSVVGAADLGGSVLTGINGNPLGVLARQLGFPLHKVRDICPLYLPNGRMVNSDVDSKVEVSFNKLLDRVCKLRQGIMDEIRSVDISLGTALEAFRRVYKVAEEPLERMLLDWHLANLEYANATLMSNLSMAFWDQDDPYEMGGDHCFIPGGNERLIRALAEDLPIFYDHPVESVRYGSDGVLVYAGGQEYRSDMVLCTVPLGVLKKGEIEFVPELPQRKKDAIERLGFGLLNKVAILFPYDFWGGEIDTFGHLTEDPNMRGEFFLFYSYSSVAGDLSLLLLWLEKLLSSLKGCLQLNHPKGIAVPDPVQAVCTRWGQDQFSYGSYSYVAIGASGDDYDILAENVADRVFFAGEATNKQYPATMHGAFLSGMREAAHIMRVGGRRSVAPAAQVNTVNHESKDLDPLFETPDLAFGSFSILFDPQSTDMESNALLRVAVGSEKSDSDNIYLYGYIERKQAIELNTLEEDVKRMEMLTHNFQVRLVGRNSLCNAAESLISRIKSADLSSVGRAEDCSGVTEILRSLVRIRQYKNQKFELKGTRHDLNNMRDLLVKQFRFPTDSMLILAEKEPYQAPTRKNIQDAFQWLMRDIQSGDSLVFYFSGHGLRQRSVHGDEIDGFDETICPVDFETNGMISDNYINKTIVNPLIQGVTLHAIIDSCHSGTVLDLPYVYNINTGKWDDNRAPSGESKDTCGGKAICFSACEDYQQAADTSAFSINNKMAGAMTSTFIRAVEQAVINKQKLTYQGILKTYA
ncbi:UNVERIFIED_CONTAM: Lysine-specific histone demethylase 11 [Sesamum radiatum]|uniref:Lysine-specific histone demethylase 11 n=1 Tax=Sesamum radiatum TaxID=300843 RepID=A0AAW2UA58_SESRA